MSGKTLKELKDRVDVVSSSSLEDRFDSTIIGRYIGGMDEMIRKQLSSSGKLPLPSIQKFMELFPSYQEQMVEAYYDIMANEGVYNVNLNTVTAQAALFDNLCFVYDSLKDEYTLATMNFDLLYDLDVEYDMLKQVATKNNQGIVKAYRIDIEYHNDSDKFTFKAVNAQKYDIDESKDDIDGNKRFFLMPYVYVLRVMKALEKMLDRGMTLRVHQSLKGSDKVRFISKDYNVLAEYCDTPEAVLDVGAKFFPLKGFFYAPVVGAPSTSAMVTNINIFDIDMVKPATEKDFKRFKISAPENPIREMIGEAIVTNKLACIKDADIEDYEYYINSFPYRKKLLSENVEDIGSTDISKYLHSIPSSSAMKVYNLLGVEEEIQRRVNLFEPGAQLNDLSELESVLRNKICRITIQKKDCKLSSILCTNSTSILSEIYGGDYLKKYEGFSVKFYAFFNWLNYQLKNNWIDLSIDDKEIYTAVSEQLIDVGLIDDPSDAEAVFNIAYNVGDLQSPLFEEYLKGYYADKAGVNYGRSHSQTNNYIKTEKDPNKLMVRTLTAYIDNEGNSTNYYRYIDKSKVVNCIVF